MFKRVALQDSVNPNAVLDHIKDKEYAHRYINSCSKFFISTIPPIEIERFFENVNLQTQQ